MRKKIISLSNNIIADVSNKPFVRCIRINNQERKKRCCLYIRRRWEDE